MLIGWQYYVYEGFWCSKYRNGTNFWMLTEYSILGFGTYIYTFISVTLSEVGREQSTLFHRYFQGSYITYFSSYFSFFSLSSYFFVEYHGFDYSYFHTLYAYFNKRDVWWALSLYIYIIYWVFISHMIISLTSLIMISSISLICLRVLLLVRTLF